MELKNPLTMILGSKKAVICLTTQLLEIAVGLYLDVDAEFLLALIAGTGAAHSVSQGAADIGKGKAQASQKVQVDTPRGSMSAPAPGASSSSSGRALTGILPLILGLALLAGAWIGIAGCATPGRGAPALTVERVHDRVHLTVLDVQDLRAALEGDEKAQEALAAVENVLAQVDAQLEDAVASGAPLDAHAAATIVLDALGELLAAESDDPATQARIRGAAALARIALRELAGP